MSGNSQAYISKPHWYSMGLPRASRITVWISIIMVFVIALLDLIGWVFNITLFKSILPQWIPMKIITALCFIFAATALVAIQVNLPEILRKILPRVLATFICLISLITLYVYLFYIRTGHEPSLTGVSYLTFFITPVSRMALLTAFNFFLIGCILFLLPTNKKESSRIAHAMVIPVTLVSYFVLVSYILGVYSVTELNEIPVALNTGIAFCGICVAIILMRPDTWLVKVVTSGDTGGIIARKLIPTLMILPVVIGWLRIKGEHAGLYESEEGVVLVAVTYTVCFLVLVWLTVKSINQSDRKRHASEEALRQSEDRFRTIAESLPVQISITRISDSTIRFTNEAYDKTFGFKRGELIGRKAHDLYFNPEERTKVIEILKEKGALNNIEVKVKKADGSPFWINSSIQTITFEGEPAYITALMDISERKKAQDELLRLNRTLNALGKSSQAKIHFDNELQYLNKICKIIIEDCGHAMVWIGYAQNDKNKSVKPVAYYGFDEGYLEKLNVKWDDTERGRGPTGTAIRTGKPVFCLNIQTDPAFEPWREEAIKRGYSSSLALPLISDGKPFGAISIYSKEPVAFYDKEITLLSDLAEDLVYGVSYIRLMESERAAVKTIKESEEKYRLLFDGMIEGFALHEIILDNKGKPCDYRFLSINPAFEKQTGLKAENIIGKKVTEVLPATEKFWIDTYGKVASTGENIDFENYSSELNSYFRVSAFSPKKGYFAVITENITNRVLAEKNRKYKKLS